MIEPYSICEKCGIGRMSPEAHHRPKVFGAAAAGDMLYHCYNFATQQPGCGNTAPMPTLADRKAAEAKVLADAKAKADFAAAKVKSDEAQAKAKADAEARAKVAADAAKAQPVRPAFEAPKE